MYGLTLRSVIAGWLMVSYSIAHMSTVANYRIDTGDSVADRRVLANYSGGDFTANFTQIIRTCMDLNCGSHTNLNGSLASIFMHTPSALAWIGEISLAGGGRLAVFDAVRNKGIWHLQLTGRGDSA